MVKIVREGVKIVREVVKIVREVVKIVHEGAKIIRDVIKNVRETFLHGLMNCCTPRFFFTSDYNHSDWWYHSGGDMHICMPQFKFSPLT